MFIVLIMLIYNLHFFIHATVNYLLRINNCNFIYLFARKKQFFFVDSKKKIRKFKKSINQKFQQIFFFERQKFGIKMTIYGFF